MTGATANPLLIVGLGLTGAAVLRFCADRSIPADATDSRAEPPAIDELRARHADCRFALGMLAAPRPLSHYGAAVVSPGVPLDDPFVQGLAQVGLPLIGDIELFAQTAEAPVVAITGSNGKSTTTALLGEIAALAGVSAAVGGNFGTPALDLLDSAIELYILELSSFQLETTASLAAAAATVLNVSEDHLDRHGDMQRYTAAKARIYRHCGVAVCNRADAATQVGLDGAGATHSFGLDAPPEALDYGIVEREGQPWLARGPEAILPVSEMRMHGRHNQANALAALALADAVNLPRAASIEGLRSFEGLPHRCRLVADSLGARWLDDSKATNVGAAVAALSGMPDNIIWIGGGQAKGQDFAPLAEALARRARLALVFGQDADVVATALHRTGVTVSRVRTLDEAVAEAARAVGAGDTVLLSPACASLDQFVDYRARGDAFAQRAREVA